MSSTKLEVLEKKAKKLQLEITKHKRKQNNRKLRARHLIQVGALLEIAEIDNEEKNILLGYFLKYQTLNSFEKDILYDSGKKELEKREKDRKEKKDNISITKEEISILLELSKEHNIFEIITKEFHKKLLENLTKKEFQILKSYINSK